jgi:hypothetical protein
MGAPHLSPFDTLEACFRLLTTEPAPMAIDGRRIGHGAPARQLPLDELRALLHHPATTYDLQRAAAQELVHLATQHRSGWIVGLAGVLLPGLHAIARSAPPTHHLDGGHLEANLLEHFRIAIQQPRCEAVEFAVAVLRLARPDTRTPRTSGPSRLPRRPPELMVEKW